MNKYQSKIARNDVWTNIKLYSGISHDLPEKMEKGLDMVQKLMDSKNHVTICKTIGKVAGNKGIIDILDTIGDKVGVVGGVLEGVTDICKISTRSK
jgi:hypothetical protein